MSEQEYCGGELDLFAAVRNWKGYWSRAIREYVSGDVLEVGAGTGSNSEFLSTASAGRWVCLEPDPRLLDRLRQKLGAEARRNYETICGTLRAVDSAWQFDTIIYVDVLEHIDDDRGELKLAAAHLRPGGRVIVLSPAHQWLFTPFDAAIGHFRRYNRDMLRSISPPELRVEKLMYLDSVGMLASAANRLLLRQSMPTEAQLQFWDDRIIPVSRVFDVLLRNSLGKSIIGVWRKPDERKADQGSS
jgi:SAM-dependent methyltransferase